MGSPANQPLGMGRLAGLARVRVQCSNLNRSVAWMKRTPAPMAARANDFMRDLRDRRVRPEPQHQRYARGGTELSLGCLHFVNAASA